MKEASEDDLNFAHKLNDLYLESEHCRDLCLENKLTKFLSECLSEIPVAINSLSFKKGSQQPHHFDTYYMPSPTKNNMVVSSICLENQVAEAGPLTYYPGSHKIKPYIFSHGGLHAVQEEMDAATSYIQQEITKRNLKEESFVGEKGDVFIWHAQLYHGGKPILDHAKTRKSLVTHYLGKNDMSKKSVAVTNSGGHYLVRNHHNI